MADTFAKFAGYPHQRCLTCTHYATPNRQAGMGWCQRFPPYEKNGAFVFPSVRATSWCGEYHEVMKRMVNKLFEDMTLDELRAEMEHWQQVIDSASQWGAHLAAANEFRRECEKWIRIKSKESGEI